MWQQNPMMFNNGYVPNYNTYNQPTLPQPTQAINSFLERAKSSKQSANA